VVNITTQTNKQTNKLRGFWSASKLYARKKIKCNFMLNCRQTTLRAGGTQSVQKQAVGWNAGAQIPTGTIFSFLYYFDGFEAHLASYAMAAEGGTTSLGIKQLELEANSFLPSDAEIWNGGAMLP
jgi:hypothetical protein